VGASKRGEVRVPGRRRQLARSGDEGFFNDPGLAFANCGRPNFYRENFRRPADSTRRFFVPSPCGMQTRLCESARNRLKIKTIGTIDCSKGQRENRAQVRPREAAGSTRWVFLLLLSGPAICWLFLSGRWVRGATDSVGWENRAAHRRSHRL
jgi:hypothetical protein